MTLPVSMEDTKLFPKDSHLNVEPGDVPFDIDILLQLRSQSRLWWSRLVISVRGYVINYLQDDELQFHSDDAFTAIHRFLAEEKSDEELVKQFLIDLNHVTTLPNVKETLTSLALNKQVPNPFEDDAHKEHFQRVFGKPNPITYRIARGQLDSYTVFMRALGILQERWTSEKSKKKGIRFETDPEWQPDDRVVLFHEFFQGNRTWVLLDFDRYILNQWRPHGASVIFGDRFVEKKKRTGMKLCAYCGMIEQQSGQFAMMNDGAFCSKECFDATRASGPTTIQL